MRASFGMVVVLRVVCAFVFVVLAVFLFLVGYLESKRLLCGFWGAGHTYGVTVSVCLVEFRHPSLRCVACFAVQAFAYLSSILGELKVNLWDHRITVPQKG